MRHSLRLVAHHSEAGSVDVSRGTANIAALREKLREYEPAKNI